MFAVKIFMWLKKVDRIMDTMRHMWAGVVGSLWCGPRQLLCAAVICSRILTSSMNNKQCLFHYWPLWITCFKTLIISVGKWLYIENLHFMNYSYSPGLILPYLDFCAWKVTPCCCYCCPVVNQGWFWCGASQIWTEFAKLTIEYIYEQRVFFF